MLPQFIRICVREAEEVFIPVHSIARIEVSYAIPQANRTAHECSVQKGVSDPNAVRVYTIFAGGEKYKLAANPGSRTMQVLEEMYKNAIKGN